MRHTLIAALLLATPLLADDVEVKLPKNLTLEDFAESSARSLGRTFLFSAEDLKGRTVGGPFQLTIPKDRFGDVVRFILGLHDIKLRRFGNASELTVLLPKTATTTRFAATGLKQEVEFNRPPAAWVRESDAKNSLAKTSVEALMAILADENAEGQAAAVTLLGFCGPRDETAVGALTASLANADDDVREAAARALGRCGFVARSALPALQKLGDAVAKQAIEEIERADSPALLNPKLAREKAPDSFKVKFETTKGDIVLEVTRAWSPHGADRFYNLVRIGYFRDIAFFRMVPSFVAQFGIHGDPRVNRAWRQANIKDDPVKQTNRTGTVSFANSGPNSRSVQFFINTADNNGVRLDLDKMGFSPFAKVVDGMDVVTKLNTEYRERPKQQHIQSQGNEYLREYFERLDYITRATILK